MKGGTIRGSPCVYPPSTRRSIKVDQGKHKTSADFPRKRDVILPQRYRFNEQPLLKASLSSGPSARYFYYFDVFVRKNVFAPNTPAYNVDIQRLLGTGPEEILHHAVVALGALQASRAGTYSQADRKKHELAGLEAYSTSLRALRYTMANSPAPPRLVVFWTTLLLGIFELMNGETGDGWLMHMVHGTANALQASGPSVCRAGLGLSFFLQARIFEASRALLLGERTFLSNPEWGLLTGGAQTNDGSFENSCLEDILDIIVQCSKLRSQVVQMLERDGPLHASQSPSDAPDLAAEGFRLRLLLELWRARYPCVPPLDSPHPYKPAKLGLSLESLLSNVFFAAISIYLSGIFDYEMLYWQRWDIQVPTITEIEVQGHLGLILSLTSVALHETSLSPLLFLFPLRIAGARCCEKWQMNCVQVLLTCISRDYAVAGFFRAELNGIWRLKNLEKTTTQI
ncbi:hypothetical protein PG985_014068 [Apiospora marii]|uniref:uncharacterized protein n=1 Tax=Apiospora marii TaxID=335849 RepID=UPI003132013F